MVADDAERHVSVGEQLFGREAPRFMVVTCEDADPWAAYRRVEGDDSDARRRGGSCVGLGRLGVGADDDDPGQVVGEAFVEEGFLSVGIVADDCHHRAQVEGGEFGFDSGEGTGLEGVPRVGEDDADIG